MDENVGQEFKSKLVSYCDEQGIDWNDALEQEASDVAAELDEWYADRPRPDLINYSSQWDVKEKA